MFGLGVPEVIVLALVILVLFGGRLPGVLRSLGQSLPAFRKGLEDSGVPSKPETLA